MFKMIKEGFAYGLGGSLGWSLGEWLAKWVKRIFVICFSFGLVMCAGYGQHVKEKLEKQNHSNVEQKK